MTKQKVYLVIERALGYNDCFYDFTGAERVVKAFRSRARAEEVARSLSAQNELHIDPNEGTDQNHVVVEAFVDLPEA
jgi:hypothetical protein